MDGVNKGLSFDHRGFGFVLLIAATCVGLIRLTPTENVPELPPAAPQAIVRVEPAVPLPVEPIADVPVSDEIYASTTPLRIINALTIADTIPATGKFIAADLSNMRLYLYQDGTTTAEYPILSKGRPGTPWATPSGFYAVHTKEPEHLSTIGHVYMPYSMQFYGNYFIHGWPYYPNGTPVSSQFSGGCIRLSTADAAQVFAFASVGTKLFVYDPKKTPPPPPLVFDTIPAPKIEAHAYLVADIDTGDVYMEKDAQVTRPMASTTKLMTALVANEVISFDKKIAIPEGILLSPQNATDTTPVTFLVNDLFYPLLMQSNDTVAEALARFIGRRNFVRMMNATADSLAMASTTYTDATGVSPDNISAPDDLFRLTAYLQGKKSFVLDIAQKDHVTIKATNGTAYTIRNELAVAASATTTPDTSISVLSFKVGHDTRHIAIIMLGAAAPDSKHLADWLSSAALQEAAQGACAGCIKPPHYRKIAF
jgi:D-alanyl-D-alanine carboxypeptidase